MNKELLRRPFLAEQIKQREGHNGKMLSYIETHAVIARLNEGCDAWSFEVVEHHAYKAEVVVVGKLIADGVIKMAFGGSAITFNNSGKAISIADDLKAAASDALKKCASLLGVGLELYGGKKSAPTSQAPARTAPAEPRESGPVRSIDRPSEKQLAAIYGVCRRKNITKQDLHELVAERAGKQRVEELTRREASNLLSELSELNGAHP